MREQWRSGTDRRGFVLGTVGSLLLAGTRASAAAGTANAPRLDLNDPAGALTAMLRLQGRLDGRDAPWWYFGRIYGVVGENAPRLLLRFEGLEIMHLTPTDAGEYAATGVTTSFFQDPRRKTVLDRFLNPYTGRSSTVLPNRLGGTAEPVTFYSTRGARPGRIAPADWKYDEAPLVWDFHGDNVWLSHDRVYPPGRPEPMGESSVARARLAELLDTSRPFVAASFSSTYFAPWPKWMEMGGRPGHVVWHADGVKLDSIAELPRDFRERMERQFPERLRAMPYEPPRA